VKEITSVVPGTYGHEITGSSNTYAFQRSCLYYFNLWNSTKWCGPTV